MIITIANGFGDTANVGLRAIFQSTLSFLTTECPDAIIQVIPYYGETEVIKGEFARMKLEWPNLRLIEPILPAPPFEYAFPDASLAGKLRIVTWSAWANLRASRANPRLRHSHNAALAKIAASDIVLLPGHTNIVQYGRSVRALASVRRVTLPIILAKRLGVRTALLNISVGPLESGLGRRLVRQLLASADYVSVREPKSAKFLAVLSPDVSVVASADMAFCIPLDTLPTGRVPNLVGLNVLSRGEYLDAVGGTLANFEAMLAQLSDELVRLLRDRPEVNLVGIPHEDDALSLLSDVEVLEQLRRRLPDPTRMSISTEYSEPVDVVAAYGKCAVSIGMRFHGYVLAALAYTPIIGVDLNSTKVRGIAEVLGVRERMAELGQPGALAGGVERALDESDELQTLTKDRVNAARAAVSSQLTQFAQEHLRSSQ